MSHALDELADLTADLKAWLEWEQCLGGVSWPREKVPRPEPQRAASPPPPRRSAPAQRPAPPMQERAGATAAPPEANRSKPVVAPAEATRLKPVAAPAEPVQVANSKWAAYANPAPLAVGSGPVGAPLVLVWTEGASEEAEAMLDKMLQGVLKLQRDDISVVTLSRVRAAASRFRTDLLKELERLKPGLVLVMGTLGTRAIVGEEGDPTSARLDWHALEGEKQMWAVRITHHPEHIRLKSAQGEQEPRREAFVDLQAVASRLL